MILLNIIVIVCLVVINGALAMSELAVVSSRRARLRQMHEAGNKGAFTALELLANPNRFLSTVQAGITLIGVLAGAFSGATLAQPLGRWLQRAGLFGDNSEMIGFVLVVAITTYFTLIVGELVPKRMGLRNPERIASFVARPMQRLSQLARPLVWLLEASTTCMLAVLGVHGSDHHDVTEAEVQSMIHEGTHAGVFDPREQAMINGVLRLDDRSARSVMVPRPAVSWFEINDDSAAIRNRIKTNGFSRFLVCDREIDNIAGVVRTHDILELLLREKPLDLRQCMIKPMIVLSTTPIISLLDAFKEAHRHMAVVVDEYGSLEGIVTMTDIVEVIVGNLPEHWEDRGEQAVKRDDGSWLVDGVMDLEDFENALGISSVGRGKDYHTVAGFVLHHVKNMPRAGDVVSRHGMHLQVANMEGHRIDKVRVTFISDETTPSDHNTSH